jgi:hypothetical protein
MTQTSLCAHSRVEKEGKLKTLVPLNFDRVRLLLHVCADAL